MRWYEVIRTVIEAGGRYGVIRALVLQKTEFTLGFC